MQFKQISTMLRKDDGIILYALSDEGQLYVSSHHVSDLANPSWEEVKHPNNKPYNVNSEVERKVIEDNEKAKEKYKIG